MPDIKLWPASKGSAMWTPQIAIHIWICCKPSSTPSGKSRQWCGHSQTSCSIFSSLWWLAPCTANNRDWGYRM